jgi:hypothetical protein
MPHDLLEARRSQGFFQRLKIQPAHLRVGDHEGIRLAQSLVPESLAKSHEQAGPDQDRIRTWTELNLNSTHPATMRCPGEGAEADFRVHP